jgi:molecular chaperone GrpE
VGEGNDDLQRAMAEAMRAVEAEERSDEATERMLEVGTDSDDEEEVVPEGDPPAEDATSALMGAKSELDGVLKKTQDEAKQLKERWLRAAADLENYRKRAAREREEVVQFGNERLLKEFLPVLDDLDRSLDAAEQAGGEGADLLQGLRMVSKKFLATLEKHGVSSFSAVGEAFDPARHEAVQQINSNEVPMGGVAMELRRGYLLNGRLIRPAMVAVSLGRESEKGEG